MSHGDDAGCVVVVACLYMFEEREGVTKMGRRKQGERRGRDKRKMRGKVFLSYNTFKLSVKDFKK